MANPVESVLGAFPQRPLKLNAKPAGTPLGRFLTALVLFAFAGLFVWMTVPGLLEDLEIAKAPTPIREAHIDGKCSTHFVLVDCDGKIAYRVGGVAYEKSRTIVFLDLHTGDYTVSAVRSATDPSLATVDIALDYMPNRIILALLLIGGFAAGGVWTLATMGETFRANKLRGGAPIVVTPIAVELVSGTSSYGTTTWGFRYDEAGKAKRSSVQFGRKRGPFVVAGPAPGTKSKGWALAARLPVAGIRPVVIDEALTAFDFTDAERAALVAARQRAG